MNRHAVGELLRDWREVRRRSQMDLAHDIGVSPRHLSFVETGRSSPSPELVLALAEGLDVPLRERNTLLLAAGYAPRFSHSSLDDPAMRRVMASIQRMLDAHDPYPGVAIDRQWNVVVANTAAQALTTGLPGGLSGPPLNVYRACLHPDGLAERIVNFEEWSAYLLAQIRRSVALTGDAELRSLQREIRRYPNLANVADQPAGHDGDPPLLVPLRLRTQDGELSLFTTLTTFGIPRDVTIDELAIELFFPADDATDAALRSKSRTIGAVPGARGPIP